MSRSSEQEFSDTSVSESIASTSGYSPLQEVPQLPRSQGAALKILVQPKQQFRFRYVSDCKSGSHGCILGNDSNRKNKTFPTVELLNFKGKATITCELIQKDSEGQHPFEISSNKNKQNIIVLPKNEEYVASFKSLKIISMLKADVLNFVEKKYSEMLRGHNKKQVEQKKKTIAESIDLDVVRLKFTARDYNSKELLCSAISEPINNEKSVKTNELKICRCSRVCGRAKGGDDMYLFVDKVDRKNIEVRFYELNEKQEVVWQNFGRFREDDVHRQYAIYLTTPPYKDPEITQNVKVYMQLRRKNNGNTSQPIVFEYRANPFFKKRELSINNNNKYVKKRKIEETFSLDNETVQQAQLGKPFVQKDVWPTLVSPYDAHCSPGNVEINPANLQVHNPPETAIADLITDAEINESGSVESSFTIISPIENSAPTFELQCTAYSMVHGEESILPDDKYQYMENPSLIRGDPLLSNPSVIMHQQNINPDPSCFENLLNYITGDDEYYKMFDNDTQLTSDSGRKDLNIIKQEVGEDDFDENSSNEESYNTDRIEKLIKDMLELVKDNNEDRQLIEEKLEQLLDIRFSNGDTYLHLLLEKNLRGFVWMVKFICHYNLTHLLYMANDRQHTVLHEAVMLDSSDIAAFLVESGCDPMTEDEEGNNAFHFGALQSNHKCLEALLEISNKLDIDIDLDAYNLDKQTPLHLAALEGFEDNVRLLLRYGACNTPRDHENRTPLHLAVSGDHLETVRVLLATYTDLSNVDDTDARGLTPLQNACEVTLIRENTLAIIKLLLENEADPLKNICGTRSALELARKKPEMWKVLKDFEISEYVYKSHLNQSDEEYFSADEDIIAIE